MRAERRMSDCVLLGSVRRALEQRYGLALEGLTEDQIASALSSALAAAGELAPSDPRLLQLVVDRLPIDESWLFREDALWTWLQGDLGPALIERVSMKGRMVRALSLGCSSGQEAFSLAILFQGLLESTGIPASNAADLVQIVGLDPSPVRIAQARDGMVNAWSVQRCRPEWLRGRVSHAGGGDMRMRVDTSIRAMCRFELGNVLEVVEQGNEALAGYDLVVCRNVLIYFRPDRATRTVAGLAEMLDPGAVLVVSATEAHLLGAAASVEPLGHLGAAQRRRPGSPASDGRRDAAKRRFAPARRLRPARRLAKASGPTATVPAAPAAEEYGRAEDHLNRALEYAGAGRKNDAVREARAALFLEPGHLFSGLLLGRELLPSDRERGREMLRGVLERASLLPPEAVVRFAPGLSVAQVASAARLLLEIGEGE